MFDDDIATYSFFDTLPDDRQQAWLEYSQAVIDAVGLDNIDKFVASLLFSERKHVAKIINKTR